MQSRQCIVGLKPICQQTFSSHCRGGRRRLINPITHASLPGCTTVGVNNVTGPMTRFLLRRYVREHLPEFIRRAFSLLLARIARCSAPTDIILIITHEIGLSLRALGTRLFCARQ